MPRKSSSKQKKLMEADSSSKKKTAKSRKKKQPDNNKPFNERAELIVMTVMLVAAALIILIGPFYRGLFFPRELLQAQVFVFGLLILWGFFRILKKDSRLVETPLDICLIVLLVAYFVSFFVAVHKRDALEELLKIGSYLVFYLVALDICRHWRFPVQQPVSRQDSAEGDTNIPPGLNLVLHLLFAVAAVITVASLGVAAGHWDFVGAYASNRIASPMGYANTAAAYLMAAYFLGLGLAPLAAVRHRVFYLAPAALMLITVILTFSRGAWLLLLPLAALLVIAAAPGQRLRSMLYLAVTGLSAVPAALLSDPVFRSDTPAQAWLIIIPSVLFAVFLGYLVELYFVQSRKLRIAIAASSLAVVAVVIIGTVIVPAVGPMQLEQPVDEPAQTRSFKQVVENIEPGETYQLSLEVDARKDLFAGTEQPEYAWRIRALGGLPGYRDEELLNYRGTATDGWQDQVFTFQTGEETTRLDIRIENRYPGTSVAARSVTLSGPDQDHRLRFTLSRILPDRYYDRIFSYSRDRNLDRRLELFEDAVKVIRDYPVLGAGGGAWAAIYRAYQDQPYDSREVHNHYLQVWIEAGLFGFLAFIGIWVSFAAAFFRNCLKERASPVKWQYWTATFLPVAALGAHSAIDWNFSMAAVGMFLFVLLGAGRSLDEVPWFEKLKIQKNKPAAGTIIGVVALIAGLSLSIYSFMLLRGLDATWDSQRLMERGNLKQAVTEMDRAIGLDPLRAENYHNLSVLTEEQGVRIQSQSDTGYVFAMAERAYEMEPYNPTYFLRYGDLLMSYVDIDQGLAQIDRLIEMRPHFESSYIRPAFSRLNVVEYLVDTGNRSAAEHYAGEIFELEEKMQNEQGDSTPMAYVVGRAHYLLGRHSEAERYYEAVEEDDQFYDNARQNLAELRGEEDHDEEADEPDQEDQ